MRAFHGTTAIAGSAMTEFSRDSGRSVLELATEASLGAVADAGLDASEVDGAVCYSMYGDSVSAGSVAAAMGVEKSNYVLDMNFGGNAPCLAVMHAAMAIEAGLASTIVVFRALNGRSGLRVGHHLPTNEGAEYRTAAGLFAYPQHIALWVQQYLAATGSTEEDLAAVVLSQREYAMKNPAALRSNPLTLEDYFAAPYVAEPLRRFDCAVELDGAAAVVVTSARRGLDLAHVPVVIRGSAWSAADQDIGTSNSFRYKDYSRNFTYGLADALWSESGFKPSEMDLAEIYDCFSGVVLMGLEGLGICGYGEAGAFHREGHTRLGGSLPVNTGGGMLAEGYMHGMNTLVEAVRQLQGGCGDRQVADAQLAVVTSGARGSGSALVLSRG